MQLYHAKAETTLERQVTNGCGSCNFTMPKRKLLQIRERKSRETLLQLYHAKAETRFRISSSRFRISLQLYHAKAETCPHPYPQYAKYRCNFTMPKRKLLSDIDRAAAIEGWLQLYHAKAETRADLGIVEETICVATLPCQSGN